MEAAVAAVAGELVGRFISFLANRYHSSSHAHSEEVKMERLHQLLMRIRTVVEEADGRYITNSGMIMQLKMISKAMYRGYLVLDNFRYQAIDDNADIDDKVSDDSSSKLRLVMPLKRSRIDVFTRKDKAMFLELDGALGSLETLVAHITEFVVLLGGCERMPPKPYDAYIYNDNIMFGRHAEKQNLLNFLLRHNSSGTPDVLPIIGPLAVGKKTLVAHVCKNERVSSHFSSILHLNEDSFLRIEEPESLISGKTLIVVEFVSDVQEKDWAKFYSSLSSTDTGSKVVILSRHKKSEKLGTVKPIFLNVLPYEEFSYLFKTLAFGSENMAEHPRLVRIADEFAKELQSGWSLVAVNLLADMMRRNLDVRLWHCMLNKLRRLVERNLSMFGKHPKTLLQTGHQIDVTDFICYPAPPLRIIPCISGSITTKVGTRRELPKVVLGELLVDPSVRPKGEFNVLTWESRMPPYNSFVQFAPSCAQEDTPLSGRKRQGAPI